MRCYTSILQLRASKHAFLAGNAGLLQVCALALSDSTCTTPARAFSTAPARTKPCWQHIRVKGIVPSARTAVAATVISDQLVLHGGLLCSRSVDGRLTADTFCLDLIKWSWARLTPSQERAVGSIVLNVPRAHHRAVAVPSTAAVMLIGVRHDGMILIQALHQYCSIRLYIPDN